MNVLMKLRRMSAEFYYKILTEDAMNWIEGRSDGISVDPDVKDLSVLLGQVYRLGHGDADDGVKECTKELL